MPKLFFNKNFNPKTMPVSAVDLLQLSIDEDNPLKAVIILPTGKYVRHLNKLYIRDYYKSTGKPTRRLNIFTLENLAKYCFNKQFESNTKRFISEAYKMTLIEEASELSDLKFYKYKTKELTNSLIKKLTNIISGLKEDGITYQLLKNDIMLHQSGETELSDPRRLADIANLYEKYQELLSDKLLDKEQIILELNLALKNNSDMGKTENEPGINSYFPNDSIMIFQGFTDFKEPELEFISYFYDSNIPVAVNLDYHDINGPLFGNMQSAGNKLTQKGFNSIVIDEPDLTELFISNPNNDTFQNPSVFLRRWLFNTEREVRNPKFDEIIKIIKTKDRQDEVKQIAKLTRHLILNEKYKPADIAVCMRKPENYSDLFREIFEANQIPVNISDRLPLDHSPLVTAVFAVLDIIVNGWRKYDINKALQNSYLKFYRNDGRKDVKLSGSNILSAAEMLRFTNDRVRGGYKEWIIRLDREIEFQEDFLYGKLQSDFADEQVIQTAQKRLDTVKKAKEDIIALNSLINWSDKKYTIDELREIIVNKIMHGLGIQDNIIEFFDFVKNKTNKENITGSVTLLEEAEKDARAFNKFIDVIDELSNIWKERQPNALITLSEYSKKLKIAVQGEKYQIREKHEFGVTVTSIEQLRGIPYKTVILCGAVDSEFPASYRTETFLGKELPDTENRQFEAECMQFYQYLTNNISALDDGSIKLFIFYPGAVDNRETVRSPFIDVLLKITTLDQEGNSKVYDLVELKKSKTIPEEIRWAFSITEQGELVRHISYKYFTELSNKNSELNQDAQTFELLNDNDHLEFAKLVINSRLAIPCKSMFDSSNLNMEHLSQTAQSKLSKYENEVFSVSDLEKYMNCPYKYFTEKLMKLQGDEETDFLISPVERGNLFHNILFEFYSELQNNDKSDTKMKLVKLDPAKSDEYKAMLVSIAEKEFEAFKLAPQIFFIEKEAFIGRNGKPGFLQQFIDFEMERLTNGWNFFPALFEYSFGQWSPRGNDNNKFALLDSGLKIRGKIDRIEFDENIENFIITDYKTSLSNQAKTKDIEDKKSLQLPIYMLAAKKILQRHFNKNIEPVGAVYYGLANETASNGKVESERIVIQIEENKVTNMEESARSKKRVFNNEELEKLLYETEEYAKELVSSIAQGKFELNKESKLCDYCNLKSFCRLNDRLSYIC